MEISACVLEGRELERETPERGARTGTFSFLFLVSFSHECVKFHVQLSHPRYPFQPGRREDRRCKVLPHRQGSGKQHDAEDLGVG